MVPSIYTSTKVRFGSWKENGEIGDYRIATTRDRFTALFWGRAPMRLLVGASTESEWVAQHLESLGHEVIVADPNFTPM